MSFHLKWLFLSALVLSQLTAVADNAEVEVSGVNPIDKKTEFINNHQIAFSAIKVNNEVKKFVAVISSAGSRKIDMYEINPTTNALVPSTTFTEHLYSPFYITFDPSGTNFYGVSGTRNFVTQYNYDAASKKFVPMSANPSSTESTDLRTACADSRFNFDYFRTVQFFPSVNKAYITCEDLNGKFYVVSYQFDPKTGLLAHAGAPVGKEGKPKSESMVEKHMLELNNPLAVLIDLSGNYLYSIDDKNILRQFKLNENGQFALTNHGLVTEMSKAMSMTFDPAGKHIYIVGRDGKSGSIIEQFKFDSSSGKLDKLDEVIIANQKNRMNVETKARARHIQFEPSGRYAYVLDNRHNVIYQYRVDPVTGNLTPLNPATYAACSTIRGLVFDTDPSSHVAYVVRSTRADLKPQNKERCERVMRDPFRRYVDRLAFDPKTGQLTNFK